MHGGGRAGARAGNSGDSRSDCPSFYPLGRATYSDQTILGKKFVQKGFYKRLQNKSKEIYGLTTTDKYIVSKIVLFKKIALKVT